MASVAAKPKPTAPVADEWVDVTPAQPAGEEWVDLPQSAAGAGQVPPDVFERPAARPVQPVPGGDPDPVQSAVGRFVQRGAEQLGFGSLEQAAATMRQFSPYDQFKMSIDSLRRGDAPDAFEHLLGTIPGGSIATGVAKHLLSDPYELIQQGEAETSPLKRAGYAGAALVPVFGKQAADIGTRAAEGDGDVAGTLGATTGLVAPLLLGGLRGPKAKFSPNEIPKTYAERTGRGVMVEGLAETSAIGSGSFRKFRIAAVEKAHQIGTQMADALTKFKGTPEQLGVEIRRQVAKSRAATAADIAQLENVVNKAATPTRQRMRVRGDEGEILPPDDTKPGSAGREFVNAKHAGQSGAVANPSTGAWADTAYLNNLAKDVRKIADDPHRTFPESDVANLRTLASELEAAPRSLPWDSAVRMVDGVRKQLAKLPDSDLTRSVPGLTLEKINKRLDRTLTDALTTLDPKLAAQWTAAQELKASAQAAHIEGVFTKLLDSKPEIAHRVLSKLSLEDARVVQAKLPKQVRQTMGAEQLRDLIDQSIVPIREGGKVIDVIDPRALGDGLSKLLEPRRGGGQFQIVVDDPALVTQLTEFARELQAMKSPRGVDVNVMDPGNQAMLRGGLGERSFRNVIGAATTKFLLSPDGWGAIRNAMTAGAGGAGVLANMAARGTQPTEAERAAARVRDRQQKAPPLPSRGSIQ